MKKHIYPIAILLSMGFFSCQSDEIQNDMELDEHLHGHEVVYSEKRFEPVDLQYLQSPNQSARIKTEFDVVLVSASYITSAESREMGRTVNFVDRGNKQTDFDFSPVNRFFDSDNTDISYYIDQLRPASPSGLSIEQTDEAIENAIRTWESAKCSDIGLNRVANIPFPIGVGAAQFGFESIAVVIADINHAGWMPPSFFNQFTQFTPGGANSILAITLTYAFRDANGNLVDTNNSGKFDVAFREIYYNNNFLWGIGFSADVETIALHEMGHGLSQEHFGGAFRKKNGNIQFNPRAIMNATYSGVQRDLAGTDLSGHCSIWGNWPNK